MTFDDTTVATTAQICRLAGFTQQRLSALEAEGVVHRAGRGQWPLLAMINALFEQLRRERDAVSSTRSEWEKTRVERERLRLQREAGRLCLVDDFNTAINLTVGRIVAGLVALPPQHHPHDLRQRRALEERVGALRNDIADWCLEHANELEETARQSARRRA
jgi:hypothetical protein